MHMADALISPVVGGAMWAATAGLAAYSGKKVSSELSEDRVPLMGVLGAFIFAAQMINFSIPGTGSSGHLGGGLILAILLGPYAGFLTMASILTIQAFFFADGGLLALGCNIFNLGFYTCFVAYPLIYKPMVKNQPSPRKILWAALLAGIVGLQLGAFSVVLETLSSGISNLSFTAFLWLMQPIHLAIGIVEGLVTAAVISFVGQARPEILTPAATQAHRSWKPVLIGLLGIALLTVSVIAWFASSDPDGLEWSLFHTTGKEELSASSKIHQSLLKLQEKIAFLPDYGFKKAELNQEAPSNSEAQKPSSPIDAGTSVAGVVGAFLTLSFAGLIGFGLRWFRKRMA